VTTGGPSHFDGSDSGVPGFDASGLGRPGPDPGRFDGMEPASTAHPTEPAPAAVPLVWERCHPASRELLLDALVWDLVDEAAPNATDAGMAALEHLVASLAAPPSAAQPASSIPPHALRAALDLVLHALLAKHALTLPRAPGPADDAPHGALDAPAAGCLSSSAREELSPAAILRDELLVGHAFAALKVLGRCPRWHLRLAIDAIGRQLDPAMLALRAPDDAERDAEQRRALRTILECAALHLSDAPPPELPGRPGPIG
jgi:uncharacterized protein YfeS